MKKLVFFCLFVIAFDSWAGQFFVQNQHNTYGVCDYRNGEIAIGVHEGGGPVCGKLIYESGNSSFGVSASGATYNTYNNCQIGEFPVGVHEGIGPVCSKATMSNGHIDFQIRFNNPISKYGRCEVEENYLMVGVHGGWGPNCALVELFK